ncbi:hypothetical protein DL765_000636 [Monosporascus sp. GIB2]|nr:hypothetical protein DL765_000636 [Monosporascus sp. GIB2]
MSQLDMPYSPTPYYPLNTDKSVEQDSRDRQWQSGLSRSTHSGSRSASVSVSKATRRTTCAPRAGVPAYALVHQVYEGAARLSSNDKDGGPADGQYRPQAQMQEPPPRYGPGA